MPIYDTPLITHDQSLDRVLNAGLPVLLIAWDGRRSLDSALDAALKDTARRHAGRLLVARIDAAANPHSAARWGQAALPALLLFKDGIPMTEAIGAVSPDRLDAYALHALGQGELPRTNGHRPDGASSGPANGTGTTRPIPVTDTTFQQEVLNSPIPVVVDFWAPWCAPCRAVAPALERLAADYGGKVKIAKHNVDENPRTAGQYGIQSIPTLLFVRNGQIADRLVGALPEPALRQRIRLFAG
jgi:thioredoxin 1